MTARRGTQVTRFVVLALVVLLLPLAAAVAADPADAAVVWQTGYSYDDRADGFLDVTTGPGGAIYCAGYTQGAMESSLLLLAKYVDHGGTVDLAWTRTFRRTGRPGSKAAKVAVDDDGNVIVAGTVGTWSSMRRTDIVVIKYSPGGARRWRTFYNGPADREDFVSGLGLDRSGNAYVSGTSRGIRTGLDFVTVKVRRGGGRAWVRRYAGSNRRDQTAGIVVKRSGDCFVTGSSKRGAHERAVTIKYSADGAFRWRSTYANDVSDVRVGAIRFGDPGTVIVGAATWNGNAEGSDALFLKYRISNGTRVWRQFLGNGEMFDESIAAMDTDSDGAFYAAGATHDENTGVTHGFMAGATASVAFPWTSEFWVDLAANDAQFQALSADGVGNCAAGGWAQTVLAGNDFAVRYRSHLGAPWSWDFTAGGTAIGDDVCREVLVDGLVTYAVGELHDAGGGTDAALFKLSQ